jgi:microcystin-dependent protein
MKRLALVFIFLVCGTPGTPAYGQEGFIGEIRLFAGNFAPRNWALCDGQLLSISQYTALFSILGATYGGDGRTTFGLPDLRGRVAVHPGDCGGDCSPVRLGEQGAENKIRQPPPAGAGWPVIHARHPYTAINYIIAVQGIYPSRS